MIPEAKLKIAIIDAPSFRLLTSVQRAQLQFLVFPYHCSHPQRFDHQSLSKGRENE